jgi:hypothetical protein
VGVRELHDMLTQHFVATGPDEGAEGARGARGASSGEGESFKGLVSTVVVQAGQVGGEGEQSMEARAERASTLALRRLMIAVCLTFPAFLLSMAIAPAHPW